MTTHLWLLSMALRLFVSTFEGFRLLLIFPFQCIWGNIALGKISCRKYLFNEIQVHRASLTEILIFPIDHLSGWICPSAWMLPLESITPDLPPFFQVYVCRMLTNSIRELASLPSFLCATPSGHLQSRSVLFSVDSYSVATWIYFLIAQAAGLAFGQWDLQIFRNPENWTRKSFNGRGIGGMLLCRNFCWKISQLYGFLSIWGIVIQHKSGNRQYITRIGNTWEYMYFGRKFWPAQSCKRTHDLGLMGLFQCTRTENSSI